MPTLPSLVGHPERDLEPRLDGDDRDDVALDDDGLIGHHRSPSGHAVQRRSSHRNRAEAVVQSQDRVSIGSITIEGNDEHGSSHPRLAEPLQYGLRSSWVVEDHDRRLTLMDDRDTVAQDGRPAPWRLSDGDRMRAHHQDDDKRERARSSAPNRQQHRPCQNQELAPGEQGRRCRGRHADTPPIHQSRDLVGRGSRPHARAPRLTRLRRVRR